MGGGVGTQVGVDGLGQICQNMTEVVLIEIEFFLDETINIPIC